MINKKSFLFFLIPIVFFLGLQSVSAIALLSADSGTLSQGETTPLIIQFENNEGDTINDVTFSMDFTGLPISTVGSSESSLDEIEPDDDGRFSFTLKAANDAKPGDYNIPFVLTYKDNTSPKKGTIGVKIEGDTNIVYTASTENPIVGQTGKINLKIINKGNAAARYVSLRLIPEGYSILSEDSVYVGTVNSDDFESVTIDARFSSKKARAIGLLEYTDVDNNKITNNIDLPLSVYSEDEAIKLGLMTKNNTILYLVFVVIIIIVWLIIRSILKRIRKKRSQKN